MEFGAILMLVLMVSTVNPPFQQIEDDSVMLYRFLEGQQGKQVLGASTQDQSPCPPERPVIGWIDYAGSKTIRESLPPGALPSACFSSLVEARSQGYQ